ncbi:MAG: 50S ribosomal protein L15 [Planctomycetaceae bacterium]|nr:50S ribosomal protein L15 [Planctomycetaceae bacterium]
MKLDDIMNSAGKHKSRKRLGRGNGSGHGGTCCRGHKGYYSRAGNKLNLGFEGGSNPMLKRIPKRGFSNAEFRKDFRVVNIELLEQFDDGATVDAAALVAAGIINDTTLPVKVLGSGELKKKLTVVASKFSVVAAQKITQAGGTVQTI